MKKLALLLSLCCAWPASANDSKHPPEEEPATRRAAINQVRPAPAPVPGAQDERQAQVNERIKLLKAAFGGIPFLEVGDAAGVHASPFQQRNPGASTPFVTQHRASVASAAPPGPRTASRERFIGRGAYFKAMHEQAERELGNCSTRGSCFGRRLDSFYARVGQAANAFGVKFTGDDGAQEIASFAWCNSIGGELCALSDLYDAPTLANFAMVPLSLLPMARALREVNEAARTGSQAVREADGAAIALREVDSPTTVPETVRNADEAAVGKGASAEARLPAGVSLEKYQQISDMIRARAKELGYGSDIFVHGSRARNSTIGKNNDIDIAIVVSQDHFEDIVRANLPKPALNHPKVLSSVKGVIHSQHAKLGELCSKVHDVLGIHVQISVIRQGSAFDKGPYIPLLPKTLSN